MNLNDKISKATLDWYGFGRFERFKMSKEEMEKLNKHKKYYWFTKNNRQWLVIAHLKAETIIGLHFKDRQRLPLAALTPVELVDLGFNIHYFENVELDEIKGK